VAASESFLRASAEGRDRRGPDRSVRIRDAEARIAFIARLLDELITIPGTRRRLGLDSIVGLIPGFGDVASAAVGGWVILEAARFRLPRVVLARMVVNTLVDLVIGIVPIAGDLFDVVFKSNSRNLALFRRHATDPGAGTREHRLFFAGLVLVLFGLLWLLGMAIAVLVYDQTRSPLLTAVAYALTCLPLLSGLAARRSPGSVAPGSPGGSTAAR